jgi:outer membrane receptor for ferric coprogen and ferric-rhodotorulic acid
MAVRLGLGAPETSIELVLSPAGPSEDVTVAGHAPYAASDTTIGKTAVPRRRVPNSVSVLTRAQMNDQNMVNTWDALSQITGITAVSNDGSQAQFHARGAALESQQDGIPSEMALSGNQQYDLAIYDRVEVLRGPAGVLQGAGAFAGTVNLVRKRPKPIFSTAAWASTGQWNNHHVEAEATGTLFSSVRGLAVVAATDREFFFERGWDRKWLGYGALEWDLRRTTIGFTAAHQRDRTPGFSGLPSYTDGGFLNVARSFNPYPSWNRYAWDTTDVGVDVSHRFTPAWRLVAKVNRRTQGFLFHDSYADDGVSRETQTTAYARRESRFDYSVNSADAYLEGRFAVWTREQEWLVGTNISRFASVGRGVSPSQEPSLRVTDVSLADPPAVSEPAFVYQTGSDSQRQQWGLYTLLRSRLTERVTSVLGGRWTN